jgi:hypothetical protein
MGQASTYAKLHGTNSENHDDFGCCPTDVRRIGQWSSEPSDATSRLMSGRSFIRAGFRGWGTYAPDWQQAY